ncbi:hypothetical protein ES702_01438 [subsurface metagenome]
MNDLEYKLIPVNRIPKSIMKKRIKKIKIDEIEIRYLQTEFPDVYKADYIQDIYKRLGERKK